TRMRSTPLVRQRTLKPPAATPSQGPMAGTCKRQSMIAQAKLVFGHIGDGEKLASVRERDPGVAQPCVMFAFFDCFFCKCRHSSGRSPSGLALRSHPVSSV